MFNVRVCKRIIKRFKAITERINKGCKIMNCDEMYDFLEAHETGIQYKGNGKVEAWVYIMYDELQTFADIVNCDDANGVYPLAELQGDSICIINLVELLDSDLEEYRKCFDSVEWVGAFKWCVR